MDASTEAALHGRIIRRLQATLPSELEFEAERILTDEPGCTKRHIIIAIGYTRSQGVAWSWAVRELQQRLIREATPNTTDKWRQKTQATTDRQSVAAFSPSLG